MKYLLPYFLCLSGFATRTPAQAQELFTPKSSQFITHFPFVQLTGGIIIIKACIDAHRDSLHFILDTGSGGISLDSQTVAELQIPNAPSDRTIRGIAGIRQVNFANNHQLKLPGLTVDSLNFHINDYSLLTSVYGLQIDGIIGFSFLKRYIVRLDYDKQMMEVYKPGLFKYAKGGYVLKPTIAGLPMQYAQVKDNSKHTGRFFLDTGAGLCLLLSEDYCTDSSLFSSKKRYYKTVTEGLGGKKDMEMAVIKEFKLGPYKFKKMPVYIFEDSYNVTSYPSLGGLIGNDLLRRFNVVINYAKSEFHLLPNTHFHEPFDYSYSGMGLFLEAGEVYVGDVIKGSPADKAGLQSGDIIIGMDYKLAGNNLQAYKLLMQTPNKKIKVFYRRNEELVETTITVKNIR